MSLIDLAKTNPAAFDTYTVQQIVGICGDGQLLDGSETSKQFREFLELQTGERLRAHANHCLENSFPKSGQVLQDIVNEMGRRIGYQVQPGKYAGSQKEIAFDGLWKDASGAALLVEVKTTDAYRINLDTVVKYAKRAHSEGMAPVEPSVLIVVGRQDTGDLEAQVRGSKHAWQVRLVSVESLSRLMLVREEISEVTFIQKVRKILFPFEYTRVDDIIDLVFETQKDVEEKIVEADAEVSPIAQPGVETEQSAGWAFTPTDEIEGKRDSILKRFFSAHGSGYRRITRAQYVSETDVRVVCSISKRYKRDYQPYWYAFHPNWLEFLQTGAEGFLILGCMDRDKAYALPVGVVSAHLDKLNKTEKPDRFYWHVALLLEGGALYLNMSKTGDKLSLEPFSF